MTRTTQPAAGDTLTGALLRLIAALAVTAGPASAGEGVPTEHKGLTVEQLGAVPSESMARQVGLGGHILLLRRITIAPGGQIAHHSAAEVPGVVYIESGAWTEGRENGETVHAAGETFIEDADTVHWFYNRGDEPASALVCDIKPSG